MDNNYYSANTFLNYVKNNLHITASASFSLYDGDHFGDVLWSKINNNIPDNFRWYNNNGTKKDYSVFIRSQRDISNFTIYADLQYRGINYKLDGADKDFVSLNWKQNYNFFNPKAGVTYSLSDKNKFYASFAVAQREPSRSDIKESIKSKNANDIKAERLLDYEIGYKYNSNNLTLSANLYFMEYKDQLVATGKLSDVGYSIKQNIPDSYRRGIELAGAINIVKDLRFDANLTLSKNKLKNYTAYIDTYDNSNDWNPLPQTEVFLKSSNLILSPEIIGMAMLTYSNDKGYNVSLHGKYVGDQYMDNFSTAQSKVPAYFVAGFNFSKRFKIKEGYLNLSATIDNLFNNKYYSYGWIYQAYFKDGSKPYIEQGVFSQAPINYLLKVSYSF
jgi:Outer membrane receptor proteins, mostly Fe transport